MARKVQTVSRPEPLEARIAPAFVHPFDLGSLNGTNGFTINGVAANDFVGAIAEAGDVNGDGFGDVMVAAAGIGGGSDNSGAAYVVFGKADGFDATLELSALNGSNGFVLDTAASTDKFFAVSGAGDVNGDGFADVVVGSRTHNGLETASGAAWVFFGHAGAFAPSVDLATLNGTNGFKLAGGKTGDAMGTSVAAAGDVNSDGFADVIVGASGVDNGAAQNTGAAYVILGRSHPYIPVMHPNHVSFNFSITGVAANDQFGSSVSGAGDVNGDGFGDVIVGAPLADSTGAVDGGASYVFFGTRIESYGLLGAKGLNGSNGFAIRGAKSEGSGAYVSEGGDINGDGFADLLVGSNGGGAGVPAKTSVLFGHAAPFTANFSLASLNGANGFRVLGESPNDGAREIHSAGDVNGDGFDDFIVGAQLADGGATDSGTAYLVLGAGAFGATFSLASVDGTNGFKLTGIAELDLAGATPRGAGDVNGDGFDDLVLGARFADPGGRAQAGQAYVIFGSDTGAVTQPGDGGANTLTGTAGVDVIIGGRAGDTLIGSGGADIFRGGEGDDVFVIADFSFARAIGGLGTDTLRLDGAGIALDLAAINDFQVRSIEAIDLTGSGANSLILTPRDVLRLSGESNTLTVFGNAGDSVDFRAGWLRADSELVGGVPFAVFFNGEAKLRVAPGVTPTVTNGFVLGGSGDFKLLGPSAQDSAGSSIANAGDVNGDGFDDVIIGARSADGSRTFGGAAYVVFGKADGFAGGFDLGALNGTNGFRIIGTAQSAAVGSSVGAAGDFNGDGFADVVVGAQSSAEGGTYAGAAYVIFGKASGFTATLDAATLDGTAGFRFTGQAANQFVGRNVGAAGDLNGDGLGDVFVSAPGADLSATVTDSGAVHVLFGQRTPAENFGPNGLFFRGFTIHGAAKGDSLSAGGAAGDVNGDGFDDLIVGARYADANGSNSGAAYVVFGKDSIFFPNSVSELNGTNGFRLRGEKAEDHIGLSVGGAGDVNGDGFADLLIGSSRAGFFKGVSYVVFGKSASFGASFDLSKINGPNGFEITTPPALYGIGHSVAGGDVNGDGFDDVIVGTYFTRLRGPASGGAFVIYGKADAFTPTFGLANLEGQNGFVLSGEAVNDLAGLSVGSGGDFNGDGFDDIVIGATGNRNVNGADSGAGYVVFGFDSGAVTHPGDAGPNTLTGDADPNVLVGGRGNDTLLGNGGNDASRGAQGADVFGLSDPNFRRIAGGTGIDTLRFDGAGLALDLTTLPDSRLSGIERIDLTGTGANTLTLNFRDVLNLSPYSNALTIVGGADDLVNLGPNWFRGVPETIDGTLFTVLHHGEATLKIAAGLDTSPIAGWAAGRQNGERGFTINGTRAFGHFGQYASSAGDVNGDGFEDIITGDYSGEVGGVRRGAAYVIFGKAGGFAASLEASALDGTNGFRISDASASGFFGQHVSGAGDVNGDGFADLIVGDTANAAGGVNAGAAHIIFGRSGGFSADLDIATLTGANGFTLTGEKVGDYAGAEVSGAGDVNGDGFADVLVSALGADPNGLSSGMVYVVFGKAGFSKTMSLTTVDGTNGFRLAGEVTRDFAGTTLAAAGDVNGDGFSDVLIGATSANADNSGAAYLVFGKAGGFAAKTNLSSLNGASGVRFAGAKAADYAGNVGAGGDINGDGFADIIIGAGGVDAGLERNGAAYVIYGKSTPFAAKVPLATLPAAAGFRIIGEAAQDSAGQSVSGGGDVNGDGFDDLLIDVPGPSFDGRFSGGVYVLLGKAGGFGSNLSLAQIDGENLGFKLAGRSNSQQSVAFADLNGDGFDDVIYGERLGTGSQKYSGVVHVFLGLDTGAVTHPGDAGANTLTGDAGANVFVGGQAGDTLLGLGGVDSFRGGQGDDIIAAGNSDFLRISGGTGIDTLRLDSAFQFLDLTTAGNSLVQGLERIDLSGTGPHTLRLNVREVLNLSPTSNTLTVLGDADDRVNFGAGWIREPDMTIDGAPFQVFTSGAATLRISAAVAHPLPSGYALTVVGNELPGLTINGVAAGDNARIVGSAGDVNGDGFDDFLVSAPGAAPNGIGSGAAYLVFGRSGGFASPLELSSLDGTSGFALRGEGASHYVSHSLSAAGDFNGDGFGDLIVASINTNGATNQSGTAYLIYGKGTPFAPALELSTIDGTNGFKLRATAFSSLKGLSVASAGDVNGDGFDDVVIGTPNFTTGALTQKGAAHVVFGRATSPGATLDLATLNGANGFTLTGAAKFESAGVSVSGGDVNGDGFSDVIVGSFGAGKTYVVFGKAAGFVPTIAVSALTGANGFTIDGASLNASAGQSVSAAGDVNGDELGDLLIGAPLVKDATGAIGAAFVVFGKFGNTFGKTVNLGALNGANGFRINGHDAGAGGEYAGESVDAAGDVNGDGFDDVVIGAAFTDSRGVQSGEAYVIYGRSSGFTPVFDTAALDGANGFSLVGTLFGARAGRSVSNAGDVNGDGFDDVLVGSYGPGGGAGRSFLVFGFDSGGVSLAGGPGVDDLGPAGANVIVGGAADDTLRGSGIGSDVLRGGQGDDLLVLTGNGFRQFDGGNGTDTLRLDGAGFNLGLKGFSGSRIRGIEQIDLRGTGANTLTLDFRSVVNLSPTSNTLVVQTDPDDFVNIGPGWISQGNEFIGSGSFQVFKQGAATLKVQEGSLAITLVNATTATFTDVDGDLATIKVSKGTLSFADFKVAPAGTVGGFQLQAVNFFDDGAEFKDANLTITAAPTALGGDGRVNVGFINAAGVDLGKVSVDGDLRAIMAGDATLTTPGLDSLSIASMGRFGLSTQGASPAGFSIVNGTLGALEIDSDLVDAPISAFGPAGGMSFGKVTIGGSIVGGTAAFTGLFADRSTGAIAIGQDIRAGTAIGAGVIQVGGTIASLTVGGSIVGQNSGFDSVKVTGTLGATKIGGDLESARITARGSLASLAVTGSVLSARVLAGYDGGAGFNGDATIGAVTVGGDWVASDLVAGVGSTDGFFGNGGESLIAGENPTKIAKITSITIKGQAIGTPGGVDHFGFVAEEIGSFSVGGTKFPLVAKASNDLSGFYVGSTLDLKVREVNATVTPIDPPLGGGGGGTPGPAFEFQLSTLNGSNGFEFSGPAPASDFSRTVDTAGDVNNDGFDDFIVSARGASPSAGVNAGEAYVVFGKAGGFPAMFDANALNGTNGFRIEGNVQGMQLGVGAAGAGDFNNDGFDDVIVGAIDLKGLGGSDTSGFVIFGKASFATTPTINVGSLNGSNGVELRAPHDFDTGVGYRMGVSGAGDLNADGFDDAIVGVINADNSGTGSGAVFVVFGRANSAATLIDMGALNGSDGFRFDSEAGIVNLGSAVSEAGDLNGDGIDDLVIGAPYATGINKRGEAYVVFGKTSAFPASFGPSALNGTTGFRISGENNYGSLGLSLDAAGDVNGDGFDDLVVGAPYASITGEFSGATYVIYGKNTSASGAFAADLGVASLNGTNGFRFVGENEYDYAGRVAGVGDVNGDGFDDIGIGALGAGTGTFVGNAYVVFGKASFAASTGVETLTAATGRKFIGVADEDQTGKSIAGVGDLNGDGLDDLLIGAYKANSTAPNNGTGAAYVVFGTSNRGIPSPLGLGTLTGTNGFALNGEAAANKAGISVHDAGDVNGDGFGDVLVGTLAEAAYVVFGKASGFPAGLELSSLTGANGFKLQGAIAGESAGFSLGSADVNDDGFTDVIVGTRRSGAYVVFGKAAAFDPTLSLSALTGTNGFKLTGPTTNALGFAVSGAGDINGDGVDDVILGDYRDDSIKGAAYVIFGKTTAFAATLDVTTLTGTDGFKLTGVAVGDRVGISVSDAGDVNKDGVADLIVGGSETDPNGEASGTAFVVYGKTTPFAGTISLGALTGANGFRLHGVRAIDQTGYSVSGAGDVNGDGFSDVIVGQRDDDAAGNQSAGHAYVVFGQATNGTAAFELSALNGANGFRLDGTGAYAHAGISVSNAGDVNGDGFADVIVGAYGYNSYAGAAYVVYGKASGFGATQSLGALNGLNGVKLFAAGPSHNAGHSVSSAGDVNGDGFDDVMVGAILAAPNGGASGAGYVVFGRGAAVGGGTPPKVKLSSDFKTATFTDLDGDLVTVKTSLGAFAQADFTLAAGPLFSGAQLQKLRLGAGFVGANITLTAVRGPDGGDGFVNVGFLDAAGVDLGKLTLEGDLGQLDAGNGDPLKPAVAALTVQSLGRLGLSTQVPAGASLESNIRGKLGAFTVKSDIAGAFVNIDGSANDGDDDSGAITIGGSIRGGALAGSGSIFAAGDLGAVKVAGSVLGGAGSHSGSIEAGGKIASVSIGDSLFGGALATSGSLIAGTTLGATAIGGDMNGGRIFVKGNLLPGSSALALAIKSLNIGGNVSRADIFAGYDREGAAAHADVQIGGVSAGRDWVASDLVAGARPMDAFYGNGDELIPGGNGIVSKIASILIKGQALGTVALGDHFGFAAEEIGAFAIGGTVFKLTPGGPNDLAGLPVGATLDVRVRETQ